MVRCRKFVAGPIDPTQRGASRAEIVERMRACSATAVRPRRRVDWRQPASV